MDVYYHIRKIFIFGQFFGLNPYRFDKNNRLVVNRWKRIIQLVISGAATGANSVIMALVIGILPHANPYTTLCRIRTAFTCCFMIIDFCQTVNEYKAVGEIFEKVRDMNALVRLSPSHGKDLGRNVAKWMAITVTVGAVNFINTLFVDVDNLPIHFVGIIVSIMGMLKPYVSDLVFWSMLKLCAYYTDYVNKEIKCIRREHDCRDLRIHSIRGHKKKGQRMTVSESVRHIRVLYDRVYNLKTQINDAVSPKIVIHIIYMFVDSLYFIFFNIVLLKYFRHHSNSKSIIVVPSTNMWIIYQFYKFMELVKMCEALAEKGQSTALAVHQFLNVCSDEDVRDELIPFSLALLHNKLQINAGGFFNVDYPLVSSMVAASVMHIIILLQFNFPGYGNGINPIEDILPLTF